MQQELENTKNLPASEQQQRVPISQVDLLFRPSIVAALANLGNTCFANSSLQVLANLPTVVGALRYVCRFGLPPQTQNQTMQQSILPPSHNGRSANVVRCAVQTLDRMERGEEMVVRPVELIRSVQEVNETFASGIGEQHDAAEWLLHGVLDACDDYRIDRSISAKQISAALADLKGVPNGTASPKLGARFNPGRSLTSQSKFNVWRAMAQVDDDNAKEEWEEKKQKNGGIPIAGDFDTWKKNSYYSPFVPRSAVLDSMRGTFLQETKCKSCGNISRIFNPLSSFELSFPSAAERVAYKEMVEEKRSQSSQKRTNASVVAQAAAISNKQQQNKDTSTDSENGNNSASSGGDCGVSPSSSLIWKILFLPCAIVTSIARAISRVCQSLFGSPPEDPVTIDELLWAYCRSRGSRFRCSKCGKQDTPGSITIRILDLPQVLAIHLKRFEQSSFGGLWTEKIPDFVEFPGSFDATTTSAANDASSDLNNHLLHHHVLSLEHGSPLSNVRSGKGLVLDLEPFMVKVRSNNNNNNNDDQQKLQFSSSSLVDDSKQQEQESNFSATNTITTYNLNSVINHHGGINGGHYTAFCKKPATEFEDEKPRWALFNDSRATEISQETVLQSQAYILMYERDTLCKEGEEMKNLRKIAKEYLLGLQARRNLNGNSTAAAAVKVSRAWLFRVATFAEPGPLLHKIEEFDGNDVPPASFVSVSQQDFKTLVDAFGELLLPR